MSRALQWVIGISAGVIALAILLAVVLPWIAGCFGFGMMARPALGAGSGLTGPGCGAPGGAGRFLGRMGSRLGMMGGYGMMQSAAPWSGSPGRGGTAGRITLDQARTIAEDYIAGYGSGVAVVEVMEFENNFYVLVEESDSGRGAFELLVDPYTGAVGPEPGPNMMWNDRYGHMGRGRGGDNPLSMDETRVLAQKALDAQLPGSKVHADGAEFYGYYTFDFDHPDGTVAGLSLIHI